jgi:hypothetical protein
VPPKELNNPIDRPKQDLILSGGAFLIRVIDPKSSTNQADPQTLFVYGQLRYWDTFTDRKAPAAKPYETWWCLQYDPATKTFVGCENGYARITE